MYGIQIAFKNYNPALGFAGSKWVGLRHLQNFFDSYFFWPVIRNTIALSSYQLIAGFPLPIILALMLNEVRINRYKRVLQTVTYLPHFISMVVFVGMIIAFTSPSTGLFNHILTGLGRERINFMQEKSAFRHIYVWSGVWQNVGWNSIIYLAALSGVDPQLHESALIDGASRMQRIRYINLPVLLPTIITLLILNTGSILNVGFEKTFLMQNDINREVSEVISTFVYQRGLIRQEFSFASAVGIFNSVVNFVILLTVNQIAKRVSHISFF